MELSNEELVIQIKAGKSELISQLWEQVYKFIKLKAGIYYKKHVELSYGFNGYEEEDLVQQGYFAMLNAIDYFRPNTYGFLTYLNFTIKTAFSEVTGKRLKSIEQDVLMNAYSADTPVSYDDTTPLIDTMSDEIYESNGGVESEATRSIYISQLHNALEVSLKSLSEQQETVLRELYYKRKSPIDLAMHSNCTVTNIYDIEHKALNKLYQSRKITGLDKFIDSHTDFYKHIGVTKYKNTNISAVESIVFEREKLAKKYLRKHCTNKKIRRSNE